MKKHFLFLLLIGLVGCSAPSELAIDDSLKPADRFSRAFIGKVISGQLDSAFVDVDPNALDDKAREYMISTNRHINGATLKSYSVVEGTWTAFFVSGEDKFTNYKLGYEYKFDKGNALFLTELREQNGKFLVKSFSGDILPAPLAELTKFTLEGKSAVHYVFLVACILVPLFILITLLFMLFSKISVVKKIVWSLVVVFVTLPQLMLNWDNGNVDFKMFYLLAFGSNVIKPAIYSAWIFLFNIPIGAIVYWFKRKKLLEEAAEADSFAGGNDYR